MKGEFQPSRLQQTFFRYVNSALSDQSIEEVTRVEATAISTPLDKVPLYIVKAS